MGYSIGYDDNWKRDIGYGVPAYCDHPGCNEEINRGLDYVCGNDIRGGADGCGLYFCEKHRLPTLCERCEDDKEPFDPKSEHPEWIQWKLTDGSWKQWRDENPHDVAEMRRNLECI